MAWGKLGSVTTAATVSDITTGVFTDNKFITSMNYIDDTPSHNTSGAIRVGKTTIDTGANYAERVTQNGAADGTAVNNNYMQLGFDGGNQLMITYGINISGEEKLFITSLSHQSGAGAGNAPNRREGVGKWVNTSNQYDIYQITAQTGGTRQISSDSNLSVLGSDAATAMKVQDGAVFYDTDVNKSYVLYNGAWSEL